MRPTKAQESILNRMAGARRFVWNWALGRWKDHYAVTGKSISLKQLSAELTALKQQPETAWLNEIDSQALQQVLKDLHQAYANHFNPQMKTGLPQFKSRKRDPLRFRIPQRVKIAAGRVYVPKAGWVRIRQSREVEGTTKGATFRRDAAGYWHVAITVEFEMPDVRLPMPDRSHTVGIDVGLIDYATFSDDTASVPAPKFFRKAQRKLGKAQRAVSRRKDGSKRMAKARARVARIHQKTANQRKDFQHKLSTKTVNDHDAVFTEDLSLQGLARTKLAKSFMDAGLGDFKMQLEYKCLWNRKHFVEVDRFFPSSKMCNVCGCINHQLILADREWDCICGTHHRRDKTAARNVDDEGYRILAAGHADSPNAQGAGVSPARCGLSASN
jgi:putative transposase